MILHTDRYFEHQYNVKLDMLCVKWPNIEKIYLPEILNSVRVLVENIRNYNIRNLLIDARETRLLAPYEVADKVTHALISGLENSRLEKLARISSADSLRETYLRLMVEDLNARYQFETRFFTDQNQALKWLETGNLV